MRLAREAGKVVGLTWGWHNSPYSVGPTIVKRARRRWRDVGLLGTRKRVRKIDRRHLWVTLATWPHTGAAILDVRWRR